MELPETNVQVGADQDPAVPEYEMTTNEWDCIGCTQHNKAGSTNCFVCGEPAPPPGKELGMNDPELLAKEKAERIQKFGGDIDDPNSEVYKNWIKEITEI